MEEAKKIVFHTSEKTNREIIHGYMETKDAITNGKSLETTQMCFLSTKLFYLGYEIHICEENGDRYQIALGKNSRTNRMILKSHKLFDLWASGEFQKPLFTEAEEAERTWAEIRCTHVDEGENKIHVDAWETGRDDEAGAVIAKIGFDGEVEYFDERAKTDPYAKEEINNAVKTIKQV